MLSVRSAEHVIPCQLNAFARGHVLQFCGNGIQRQVAILKHRGLEQIIGGGDHYHRAGIRSQSELPADPLQRVRRRQLAGVKTVMDESSRR